MDREQASISALQHAPIAATPARAVTQVTHPFVALLPVHTPGAGHRRTASGASAHTVLLPVAYGPHGEPVAHHTPILIHPHRVVPQPAHAYLQKTAQAARGLVEQHHAHAHAQAFRTLSPQPHSHSGMDTTSPAVSPPTASQPTQNANGQQPLRKEYAFVQEMFVTATGELQSKPKRKTLSQHQSRELAAAFQRNDKPKTTEREALAEQLGLTQREVQIWFQNRRAKLKQRAASRETSNQTSSALLSHQQDSTTLTSTSAYHTSSNLLDDPAAQPVSGSTHLERKRSARSTRESKATGTVARSNSRRRRRSSTGSTLSAVAVEELALASAGAADDERRRPIIGDSAVLPLESSSRSIVMSPAVLLDASQHQGAGASPSPSRAPTSASWYRSHRHTLSTASTASSIDLLATVALGSDDAGGLASSQPGTPGSNEYEYPFERMDEDTEDPVTPRAGWSGLSGAGGGAGAGATGRAGPTGFAATVDQTAEMLLEIAISSSPSPLPMNRHRNELRQSGDVVVPGPRAESGAASPASASGLLDLHVALAAELARVGADQRSPSKTTKGLGVAMFEQEGVRVLSGANLRRSVSSHVPRLHTPLRPDPNRLHPPPLVFHRRLNTASELKRSDSTRSSASTATSVTSDDGASVATSDSDTTAARMVRVGDNVWATAVEGGGETTTMMPHPPVGAVSGMEDVLPGSTSLYRSRTTGSSFRPW
ncbi:hypothetical protein M427DRAFT_133391 [Gonapodya prolifera JEL478]|uniref:Homeobox domain-containing protein n=1 Tax=Gonapodya prolifera (strain JEL478) TaxID=1344416 RepID=A0A139AMA2_GONPJ|nr:hypothetical protein M427DRAFT_133391 [Gonapodya prolifera JEL478]|eukprot:KXS17585.1 hypothetical protein M427DRAFT_133391 [Gonapodya prolifera JEL478]